MPPSAPTGRGPRTWPGFEQVKACRQSPGSSLAGGCPLQSFAPVSLAPGFLVGPASGRDQGVTIRPPGTGCGTPVVSGQLSGRPFT